MDWPVWPVFTVQVIAFIFMLFPRHGRVFGIRFKVITIILLLISCVMIALSLHHDSTEVLNLHF